MPSIESIALEVADPTAADRFYKAAFGLGGQLRFQASAEPTAGFRGFTLSLTVPQPGTVSALIGDALKAGATALKPVAKSFWGYGGVVQAPDGTIWKVATSAKKDTGPATRQIDQFVLLLGAVDAKPGRCGQCAVTSCRCRTAAAKAGQSAGPGGVPSSQVCTTTPPT
jgi:catechol 2,3-dioxygenase-like lactoylglutathione lyase family enzyme